MRKGKIFNLMYFIWVFFILPGLITCKPLIPAVNASHADINKGEISALYQKAIQQIEMQDMDSALAILLDTQARIKSTEVSNPSVRELFKTLEIIMAGLLIRMPPEWRIAAPDRFEPVPGKELPRPALQVVCLYRGAEYILNRITINPDFISGSGLIGFSGQPSESGYFNPSSFNLDYTDRQIQVKLQLNFTGNDGSYALPLSLELLLPSNAIRIEVKLDERMLDFVRRLEESRLTTKTAVLKAAATLTFPRFAYVPGPQNSLSRFEGLFVPAEYWLPLDQIRVFEDIEGHPDAAFDNAAYIITLLLEASASRFRPAGPSRVLSVYDELVLASIVEKESVCNSDYDKIASVFYNSLQEGRALCSCPSVEYALGFHRPFLIRDDIAIDSLYNLYKYRGLPPTPICFFSSSALDAVRYPLKSGLHFFVFDWIENRLYFAEDYAGHVANVNLSKGNYIKVYGKEGLYKIYRNKYYER